jgi:pseudoazurin
MRILTTLGLLLGLSFLLPVGVLADELPTEYTVEMWNKDPDDKKRKMVFSEEIIAVAPGAAVTWLATDKGHNVQIIAGPEGYDLPKKSKLSKDVTLTFDQEGVYVYVCTPHASMGMIGIVVVGDLTQEGIDAIKDAKVKGKSKKKFKALLAELP